MNQFKDFIVKCVKCGSESTEIYAVHGGCDSCDYGSGLTVSCNNCKNVESTA